MIKAVNTFELHGSTVRGASRAERNMLRAVNGGFGELERRTWQQVSVAII